RGACRGVPSPACRVGGVHAQLITHAGDQAGERQRGLGVRTRRQGEGIGPGKRLQEERILGNVAAKHLARQRPVRDTTNERVRERPRRKFCVVHPQSPSEAHPSLCSAMSRKGTPCATTAPPTSSTASSVSCASPASASSSSASTYDANAGSVQCATAAAQRPVPPYAAAYPQPS